MTPVLRLFHRVPTILLATVAGTCASVAVGVWCGATVAWAEAPGTPPSTQSSETFVLHIVGVGGKRTIDRMLIDGLAQGGVRADFQIYDWTGEDQGLVALGNPKRHEAEATNVAQIIEAHYRANPTGRIVLTCHSAGAGITAWALERLPADVKIDQWILLAPALSPQYDLSTALSHVKTRAFAFTSVNDAIVLGAGTRLMGTVDRVHTDAAGRVGFQKPDTADAAAYAKLQQVPYDSDWMRYGNVGDHIGALMRPFVRRVIAPTVLEGVVPVTHPTTEPGPKGPA